MPEAAQFYSPATVAAALDLMAAGDAQPLAGGTDAMVRFHDGMLRPQIWVNLQPLRSELAYIRQGHGMVSIGALTTFSEIIDSPLLQATAPLLLQACGTIGGPQIRNMGTLGGNLGTASPAADSLPALYALEAWVSLVSKTGLRELPIGDFFLGPGRTALRQGELIAAVRFAPQVQGELCTFEKLGLRAAHAITLVSAAIRVLPSQDGLRSAPAQLARVTLGAVAPTVFRVPAAEQLLTKEPLNSSTVQRAAEAASRSAHPISDLRASASYRQAMARNLIVRGLTRLTAAEAEVNRHVNG